MNAFQEHIAVVRKAKENARLEFIEVCKRRWVTADPNSNHAVGQWLISLAGIWQRKLEAIAVAEQKLGLTL